MIAEGYLQAGAKVYISARKKETCDRTADELSRVGDCVSLPADVSTTQGRAALVKTLSDNERALHILVNNAGANWGAPYDEFPEKGFHKVVDLNLIAVFFLTRDLTPLLERAGTADDPARVINIGSMDGVHVPTTIPTGVFAYSSSKAGVHHLSRHLAVELGPRHITVNAVAPGYFESKMTEEVLEQYGDQIRGALSDGQARAAGRDGRCGDLSGVARGRVHQRRCHRGRRRDLYQLTVTVRNSYVDFPPSDTRAWSTYVPGFENPSGDVTAPSSTGAKNGVAVTPAGPRQTTYETDKPSGGRARCCAPRLFTFRPGTFLVALVCPRVGPGWVEPPAQRHDCVEAVVGHAAWAARRRSPWPSG